jgi:mannose-6-phosphate isomerase-like protein (cupin superfamily)
MIMAILGGDDAGGGVIWAPQVIEEAKDHGLVLSEKGRLHDTRKGETLPEGVGPMPVLTEPELSNYPELSVCEVVPDYVARYEDMMALAAKAPCKVIGDPALIVDRPGFEVDLVSRGSGTQVPYATARHEVLMVVEGHWRLGWDEGEVILAPGDTCAVPPGLSRSLAPSMSGRASLYRVRSTDDPAGPTWRPEAAA